MLPSKREFDEEKSKHRPLCQQNSFGPAFFSTGFFFWGKISSNFNLKIYDFNLCKGFFMENMAQIRQISKKRKH
jgi:hypothetical protein